MNNKYYKDLEAKRQKAMVDKDELFDFYHGYWEALVNKTKRLEEEVDYLENRLRSKV